MEKFTGSDSLPSLHVEQYFQVTGPDVSVFQTLEIVNEKIAKLMNKLRSLFQWINSDDHTFDGIQMFRDLYKHCSVCRS